MILAYIQQASGNPPNPPADGGDQYTGSWYQLLGNNSNTFIRQVAKLIGRNPDVIGGGWIADNQNPQPVPYPSWTPVYSP
jgi:hypothetical protein